MSDPNQLLNRKFITNMAVAGGGVGLLGVLWDALRSESRRVKALQGKDKADDVLRIKLPKPGEMKQASFFTNMAVGLATSALSIAAVKRLALEWRKKKID
jgi:hypothetical protein